MRYFSIGVTLLLIGIPSGVSMALLHHRYDAGIRKRNEAIASWAKHPAIIIGVSTNNMIRHGSYRKVTYRYEYRGRTFESSTTSFFGEGRYKIPATLETLKAEPRVGKQIEVLLDPSNPHDSVRLPWDVSEEEAAGAVKLYSMLFRFSLLISIVGAIFVWLEKRRGVTVKPGAS